MVMVVADGALFVGVGRRVFSCSCSCWVLSRVEAEAEAEVEAEMLADGSEEGVVDDEDKDEDEEAVTGSLGISALTVVSLWSPTV